MISPNQQFLEVYRTALSAYAAALRVSMESAERLREKQFAAVREAIDDSRRGLSEIAGAGSMNEVLAQQVKLAGAQVERALSFWSSLYLAAGENQAEITWQLRESASQFRDALNEALGAASYVSEPVRQAMQDVLNTTFASTARVTEEAARSASAQAGNLDSASAGIRQNAVRQERKSA